MSKWAPDNIRDVGESVGFNHLDDELITAVASAVESILSTVIEKALVLVQASGRSALTTRDIGNALQVLGVEPLYGYESTRRLRFGEAFIGSGHPIYYVEDEEMDLEKLINAPLPKVPRPMALTGHYTALEGVQPTIPQNPTTAESLMQVIGPKLPGANASGLALTDDVTVRPRVHHVVSEEHQQYFERVAAALLDPDDEHTRRAALSSVRFESGLHQLVPYFVQFIGEKVTHNLRDVFVLTQVMHLAAALMVNNNLHFEPYAGFIVPPILTCVVSRRLGNDATPLATFALRALGSSILGLICWKFSAISPTLRPRLVRAFLKIFLNPNATVGMQYGAMKGMHDVGGPESIRTFILPNLKEYGNLLLINYRTPEEDQERGVHERENHEGENGNHDSNDDLRPESGMVMKAILEALLTLENKNDLRPLRINAAQQPLTNGHSTTGAGQNDAEEELLRTRLQEKLGPVIGSRVYALGRPRLNEVILSDDWMPN
ncbi:MAG: decapping endonuclease targeting mRNA [Watsoniomyces obsoletus]|nr:MAG: decapping endonuclease targeting mRNA [Watsoniomyces obsoletus]